jgi:hypothetical protein
MLRQCACCICSPEAACAASVLQKFVSQKRALRAPSRSPFFTSMAAPSIKYNPAVVPYGALAAALARGLTLTHEEDSKLPRDAPPTLTLPSGYVLTPRTPPRTAAGTHSNLSLWRQNTRLQPKHAHMTFPLFLFVRSIIQRHGRRRSCCRALRSTYRRGRRGWVSGRGDSRQVCV